MSKGSVRRPTDPKKFDQNFDKVDWSKKPPEPKPPKAAPSKLRRKKKK